MPIISIIVPVYNSEKYLCRCIDSILNQTFSDFELLLIDDGSTDGSGIICDEYAKKDSRIRVFHKKNGGVSSARNLGIDNAKGEWITFCDSDDWVYPNWLENYDVYYNSNYDLISQGFETDKPLFGIGENKGKYTYYVEFDNEISKVIEQYNKSETIGFLWIKLFKSEIICKNNMLFDERLKRGEDHVFIFKYLLKSLKIKGITNIGYHYNAPNWNTKYQRDFKCDIIVGEELYKSACMLTKDRSSEVVRHYREDLTSIYVEEFKVNNNNRGTCIRGLRNILLKDFWYSQLFFITKIFILLDCSYVISYYILRFHFLIKNKWM